MDLELSLVQYSGNARLFSCANSPLFLPFFYSRCTRAVLCWVPPFWILCAGSWTAQEGCCCTMLGCSDLRETRINSTAISSDALFYRTSIHLPTLNKKTRLSAAVCKGGAACTVVLVLYYIFGPSVDSKKMVKSLCFGRMPLMPCEGELGMTNVTSQTVKNCELLSQDCDKYDMTLCELRPLLEPGSMKSAGLCQKSRWALCKYGDSMPPVYTTCC